MAQQLILNNRKDLDKMSNLDELKQEAQNLGITFSPNIGEAKLQAKIDEFYEERDAKEAAEMDAQDAKIAAKIEADEDAALSAAEAQEVESAVLATQMTKAKIQRKRTMGQIAREAEKNARKTRVIEIIDNDSRENAYTTTVSATCGNAYFDLGTIILPLNTPVEVMQGHINSIKEVKYPHHQLNTKTNLAEVTMRKRYTISYVDMQ